MEALSPPPSPPLKLVVSAAAASASVLLGVVFLCGTPAVFPATA